MTRTSTFIILRIMKNISEYIRSCRRDLGYTQKKLAEKTGSNRGKIAKYETDRSMPPGEFILKLQDLMVLRARKRAGLIPKNPLE